jgi:hypothetical protein
MRAVLINRNINDYFVEFFFSILSATKSVLHLSAAEATEDDAALIVENRKTGGQLSTNQKAAAQSGPTKRIGYLPAGQQYATDPQTGYLVDSQSGQPLTQPPGSGNSWAVYSGQP